MNKDDYLAGIDLLRDRVPDHPLMDIIVREFNTINVAYLEEALKDLPPEELKEEKVDYVNKSSDPVVNQMNQRINKLYGKRAKLSNSFHDCNSDLERASVSKQILVVQEDIEQALVHKQKYKATGYLPKKQSKYEIPSNPIELFKMRNSLYSRISQIKKELKELHYKNGAAVRKNELEKMLSEKEIILKHVKKAIG